jgi:hypothetical protein
MPGASACLQGFYYNLLLDHKAFDEEEYITPVDGDYFMQCIREGVFSTEAELEEKIKSYAKYTLMATARLDSLRGEVRNNVSNAQQPLGAWLGDAADENPQAVLLAGADALQEALNEEGGDGVAGVCLT